MKQSHLIGLATPLLLSAGTLATAESFINMHFAALTIFQTRGVRCKSMRLHIIAMSTGSKVRPILRHGI